MVAYWLPKVRADRLVAGPAGVQSFYEMAKEQEYRTVDVSPEVKKTVARWDQSSGPVMMFQPAERRVGFFGRPVEVDVKVVRRRGKFLETCVLGDGLSVSEIRRSPLK
ncbi:hypothetical protein OP10G_1292 [Fimbriimonas ginsengisoli Gsoil 348]|uniref:Uncharacterized protein n=1 Tax=Fimbriimonas ginsengisoli Gsoil 348 TaxID=661478 RepID=A0A068NPJ8_FIMGI|nr:hypothetical protein OP10G_1292 [Fimbriimonas ginsengisoli Gsoil 348]